MEERFIARNSLLTFSLLLAALIGLLLASLWPRELGLTPKPQWEWMRWVAVPLMGFAAVMLVVRLFDRRDRIVVDRNGILWRSWSDEIIPWRAIADFRIEKQYYYAGLFYFRHLCLYLHEPAPPPRMGWRARLFGRGSNLGFGDITVSTIGMDRNVDDLLAALERFAPSRRES